MRGLGKSSPADTAIALKTSRLTSIGHKALSLIAVSYGSDLPQDNTVRLTDNDTDAHA